MILKNTTFDFQNRVYIMGILNVTPDSFSDGGKHHRMDAALRRVETMIEEGADIIDVGGESTRPGYQPVPYDIEIERTAPVIEKIVANFDIPVSIDTFKWQTWEAAIHAGADMLNDIWGFQSSLRLAELTAEHDKAVILMHNRKNTQYDNFLEDVIRDLQCSLSIAEKHGVSRERILLDPGIGFAKDHHQNLALLHHLEKISALGYPVLLGTSRKRFLGRILNDIPPAARGTGTAATTAIGVLKGASIFRVHDIRENAQAAAVALAIRNEDKLWTPS